MLRYKFKIADGQKEIKIPLTMDNQMVDQSEIIERKFVDVEVEKSINNILDYEKTKYKPYNGNIQINKLTYNVKLLDGNTYGDIGFNDIDIEGRSNAFKNTFLRLSFYDTDKLSNQRLMFFITLFSNVYEVDNIDATKPLTFHAVSEKTNTLDPSEGFNIFYFKDEVVLNESPSELYMRAEFNNAKTGQITNLMTLEPAVSIDNLVNQLHTKYLLKKVNGGYRYEVDDTFDVTGTSNRVINLYEVNAL